MKIYQFKFTNDGNPFYPMLPSDYIIIKKKREWDFVPDFKRSTASGIQGIIERELQIFAINNIYGVIPLYVIMLIFSMTLYMAFRESSDWNILSKVLVATIIPGIIIAALTNVNRGNIMLMLWCAIFWITVAISFLWVLVWLVIQYNA